jgi:hypothetical protein
MRFLATLILFISCLSAFAQNPTSSDIIQPKVAQPKLAKPPQGQPAGQTGQQAQRPPLPRIIIPPFPKSWQGKYRGDLLVYTMPGLFQRVPMTIEIRQTPADTNRYKFVITYGGDSLKGARNYEIVSINPARGIYQIDEKNSIKTEAFFLMNRLINQFTIQGIRNVTSYERQGESLIFEAITGRDAYISASGGGKAADAPADAPNLPVLQTFPLAGWQRAVLKRDPGSGPTPAPAANAKNTPAKPAKKL